MNRLYKHYGRYFLELCNKEENYNTRLCKLFKIEWLALTFGKFEFLNYYSNEDGILRAIRFGFLGINWVK
jgi:hypothetical protein